MDAAGSRLTRGAHSRRLFATSGFNGHEHSYERSYPTYRSKSDRSNLDPTATIYVVTGAAGCAEMHEGDTLTPPRL